MFNIIDIRYLTVIFIVVLIFLKFKFLKKEIKKEKTSFKLKGWTMIYSDTKAG